MKNLVESFQYAAADPPWENNYLWRPVSNILAELSAQKSTQQATQDRRLFELGCGNGVSAYALAQQGFEVTAIDASESGIEIAKKNFAGINFATGSAYDDLAGIYGRYPIVMSLEVIEHLYSPVQFAKTVFDLLEPDGTAIISTPYHGYLKNLAVAVSGKFDTHVQPLSDGGHIKFFSKQTLATLLGDAGFSSTEFVMAGRIPALAKSMIAVAKKPPVRDH
nr:putative SAM-dependent methyltransferase [uncultured bacterium]